MSAYQPRSLPCDADRHDECALPASCGCSCHPPVVGDDGIPHHAEMTAGGMNRCLPGCPATSGHRGVPGGAA